MKEYYENGQLSEEIPYKDDKIDGIVKKYYENGVLKCKTTYTQGQKTTNEICYDENGKIIK